MASWQEDFKYLEYLMIIKSEAIWNIAPCQ